MEQNDESLKYLIFYKQVLPVCEGCSFYMPSDDECLVEDKKIFDIVSSSMPSCPIGEW